MNKAVSSYLLKLFRRFTGRPCFLPEPEERRGRFGVTRCLLGVAATDVVFGVDVWVGEPRCSGNSELRGFTDWTSPWQAEAFGETVVCSPPDGFRGFTDGDLWLLERPWLVIGCIDKFWFSLVCFGGEWRSFNLPSNDWLCVSLLALHWVWLRHSFFRLLGEAMGVSRADLLGDSFWFRSGVRIVGTGTERFREQSGRFCILFSPGLNVEFTHSSTVLDVSLIGSSVRSCRCRKCFSFTSSVSATAQSSLGGWWSFSRVGFSVRNGGNGLSVGDLYGQSAWFRFMQSWRNFSLSLLTGNCVVQPAFLCGDSDASFTCSSALTVALDIRRRQTHCENNCPVSLLAGDFGRTWLGPSVTVFPALGHGEFWWSSVTSCGSWAGDTLWSLSWLGTGEGLKGSPLLAGVEEASESEKPESWLLWLLLGLLDEPRGLRTWPASSQLTIRSSSVCSSA